MGTSASRLSYRGAAVGLAATLVVVFVLCAIAQVILPGAQFSHMWIQLFTAAHLGSVQAWVEGIIASVVFGLVAGHVFAFAYNWTVKRS